MTLCIPLCICRLTLAWISSKISTKLLGMPPHLDWYSFTAAGPYLIRLVSLLSVVDFICHSPPTDVFEILCPALTLVPLPTSGHVEDRRLWLLFSFTPKQTNGLSAWRTTYIVSQALFDGTCSTTKMHATIYTQIYGNVKNSLLRYIIDMQSNILINI